LIRDLEQTVGDFLDGVVPELAANTRRISLRHLLTMTSGRPWRELNSVTWASGYGYLWWTAQDARTGRSYFFAVGYGGQFVIDVPSANTVIVATTAWNVVSDAGANFMSVLGTIVEDILPSLG
jgi:CubicO group peptidase (beta-lactamase class C family)